jgi:hypothetical protein
MDIQQLLLQMRQEAREDMQILTQKVDDGFTAVAQQFSEHEVSDTTVFGEHEQRLAALESTKKDLRWVAGAVIVAVLGAGATALWDFVAHHVR